MRSNIENSILNKFLEIYSRHQDPVWAYDEIEYLIFDKYQNLFYELDLDDQWEVRTVMIALKKIYN